MNQSTGKYAIVITSIASPNGVIKAIAKKCSADQEKKFFVIGDTKSPTDFHHEGCDFYSIEQQINTGFTIAANLPTRHYSRKNIGYLLAWKEGFEVIVETDDDNIPIEGFWENRFQTLPAQSVDRKGWANVYRLFADDNIWPRGLPLEHLHASNSIHVNQEVTNYLSPIQQGLANENPDVDAVYRMTMPLPFSFLERKNVVLEQGVWCPFNSQNTTWFREAFPLLYLPSYCSFRMTDIWRSFIAQRIAWTNGWNLLFHNATVVQERNEHSLLKDFEDEVSGYLLNHKIITALDALELKDGIAHIYDNLFACYVMMIEKKFINNETELQLVKAWINDCKSLLK
jgi:hypothetical protein